MRLDIEVGATRIVRARPKRMKRTKREVYT